MVVEVVQRTKYSHGGGGYNGGGIGGGGGGGGGGRAEGRKGEVMKCSLDH